MSGYVYTGRDHDDAADWADYERENRFANIAYETQKDNVDRRYGATEPRTS